jgi:hypothetical protein
LDLLEQLAVGLGLCNSKKFKIQNVEGENACLINKNKKVLRLGDGVGVPSLPYSRLPISMQIILLEKTTFTLCTSHSLTHFGTEKKNSNGII